MHAFRLAKRDAEGVTLADKGEHLERTTGRRPAFMDGPEMPPGALHVWEWFQDLQRGRTSNGFGLSTFSWSDLQAFFSLTGIDPRPWEVRLIRTFDHAYLAANATEENTNDGPRKADDRG
ncbi:MAG TPA: hypothetical protein VK150_06490 [Geothrix sp.]|nr:hypothetical protein [Geothrix sp.]